MLRTKSIVASFTISHPSRNPANTEEAFEVFKNMGYVDEASEYFIVFASNQWHLYKLQPIQ